MQVYQNIHQLWASAIEYIPDRQSENPDNIYYSENTNMNMALCNPNKRWNAASGTNE